MSSDDPAPEEQLDEGERGRLEPKPLALPKWVPAAIAVVLVALAALAVYTGLRYRGSRIDRSFVPTPPPAAAHQDSGAPGEPEAGASRVHPGEGNNVPQPSGAGFAQGTRVAVVGGKEGLSATYRASARRGLILAVQPDDAMLYVNDQAIGPAKQFGTEDEMYEFPAAGNYTIRLEAQGFKDIVMYVAADPYAPAEIAKIEMKMMK
jgi:hypothetical protein